MTMVRKSNTIKHQTGGEMQKVLQQYYTIVELYYTMVGPYTNYCRTFLQQLPRVQLKQFSIKNQSLFIIL